MDPPPTSFYTLSLHDALPISLLVFGVIILFMNRLLLGDNTRFVTHGGKGGFRAIGRGSKLGAVAIVLYGLFSTVLDRKSTRLNSSHPSISYAVFCLKKKKKTT